MTTDSDFNHDSGFIAIPEKARHLSIDESRLTTRLGNVLRRMGCERLGDLHGLTYSDVCQASGCGRLTLHELKTLIAELNSSDPPSELATARLVAAPPPFPFSAGRASAFESERIDVPERAQDLLIGQLSLPARLGSILLRMGCERLGDLRGRAYQEVWETPGCGWTTIWQLKTLIDQLGCSDLRKLLKPVNEPSAGSDGVTSAASPKPAAEKPVIRPQSISIPEHARDWPLDLMPRSTRLRNILRVQRFTRLGDLHGLSFKELLEIKSCGHEVIAELRSLAHRVQEGEFDETFGEGDNPDLRALLDALDRSIDKLPERAGEIILWRFGATDQLALTLEEIGAKYDMTREGVRQNANRGLRLILRNGGPAIALSLKKLAEKCLAAVCPLTPETLAHRLGEGAVKRRFAISFYVHLCGALQPEIPAWPYGQKRESASKRSKEIVHRLKGFLHGNPASLSLSDALDRLRKESPNLPVQPSELLEALRGSDSLLVEFVVPDRPMVKLPQSKIKKSENTFELARAILSESDRPLSGSEIIERARHKSGEDFKMVVIRALWYVLTPERGFYLLDRSAFGLRQHFRLPESSWDQVRSDFHDLLSTKRRLISTFEVVSERMFEWSDLANAYEIAQILREDSRFVDLGRHLFALPDWGIEEREMIGDLIVKILEEAARPIPVSQLTLEIRRFRSIAHNPVMSQYLREKPEICSYGAGYYGLKSWGDRATEFLIAEPRFINDFIMRLPPPLNFKEMCQYLKIPDTGPLADRLWQTIALLPNVRKYGGENMAEIMLRHEVWNLEYSLYAMLSQFDRPLSVREIQEVLGGCFGLSEKAFANRIKRCHRWSSLFARTRDGKYELKEEKEGPQSGKTERQRDEEVN